MTTILRIISELIQHFSAKMQATVAVISCFLFMVISNCYNCQLNLQIPRRRTGDYTHKEKCTLTGLGVLFFADCLKVINHPNAQYDYLLILVDGFSNFCIAQAYKAPMTNELFLQIFMDRCLAS